MIALKISPLRLYAVNTLITRKYPLTFGLFFGMIYLETKTERDFSEKECDNT